MKGEGVMTGFSDIVKQKLQYYVYALIDPRNNEIFYVGKGTGDRIFDHEKEKGFDTDNTKVCRINDIKNSGNEVKKIIVLYGLAEKEAFVAEATMINLIKYITPADLTNVVSGHHADKVMTVEEIESTYGAEVLTERDIFHNLLVVKINSLYDYNMTKREIMDCARGHWVINAENAEKADYLVAVYHGIVVGVYENMKWYSSGEKTEYYPRLSEENLQLANRKYCTCIPVINSKYINKNIGLVVRDTQNPVSYIWGRKNAMEVLQPYYDLFCGRLGKVYGMFEYDFGDDMVKMGYEMDAFARYNKLGKNEVILRSNDYLKIKQEIKDIDYLTATSILISQWRYLTHWAYFDYVRYEDDKHFFKAVLERIFELCSASKVV